MLAEPVPVPGGRGIITRGGPVVDATLAGSPSPARNRERSRDPEAHQARKGTDRHLGHEAHAGVDAGTGLARTVEVTAANVSDVAVAPSPLRPDDDSCHAGAGHAGAGHAGAQGRRPPGPLGGPLEDREAPPGGPGARPPGGLVGARDRELPLPCALEGRAPPPRRQGPPRAREDEAPGPGKNRNQPCVALALADLALLAQAGKTLAPTCA